MIDLPNLTIGIDGPGPDALINLQQESGGQHHTIDLHPMHVRLMAERLGLLQGDPDAWRQVATLERRLRALHDRILFLDKWLHECSDTAHADLSYEQTFSAATCDLSTEFIADLSRSDRDNSVTSAPCTPVREADPSGSRTPTPLLDLLAPSG